MRTLAMSLMGGKATLSCYGRWAMESLADNPRAAIDLKRRTRWYWGVGLGQVLATMTLVPFVSMISEWCAVCLFIASAVTYIPAYVGVSIWLMRFKCPRCERSWVEGMPPPFTTKCSH